MDGCLHHNPLRTDLAELYFLSGTYNQKLKGEYRVQERLTLTGNGLEVNRQTGSKMYNFQSIYAREKGR
jgi:hypothetical protein